MQKRLALHLGLVDVQMSPHSSPEEHVQVSARDQGWLNRLEANRGKGLHLVRAFNRYWDHANHQFFDADGVH